MATSAEPSFNLHSFARMFSGNMEPSLRLHLKNVYASLTLATVAATAGAAATFYTNFFNNWSFLTFIASLAMLGMILFSPDPYGKNQPRRMLYLAGFGACTGAGMGPLLDYVMWLDPSIVVTAFSASVLVFVSFTLCSLFATRGKWLFLGGIIATVCNTMLAMTIGSMIFGGSRLMYQAHVYVGLAVFCAYILYDTQLIVEKHRMGSRDAVAHALELFIDLVSIFRRILIILADKNENKQRRRSN